MLGFSFLEALGVGAVACLYSPSELFFGFYLNAYIAKRHAPGFPFFSASFFQLLAIRNLSRVLRP